MLALASRYSDTVQAAAAAGATGRSQSASAATRILTTVALRPCPGLITAGMGVPGKSGGHSALDAGTVRLVVAATRRIFLRRGGSSRLLTRKRNPVCELAVGIDDTSLRIGVARQPPALARARRLREPDGIELRRPLLTGADGNADKAAVARRGRNGGAVPGPRAGRRHRRHLRTASRP